jgi:hypothetical protein
LDSFAWSFELVVIARAAGVERILDAQTVAAQQFGFKLSASSALFSNQDGRQIAKKY